MVSSNETILKLSKRSYDSFASLSVTIRVMRFGHPLIHFFILQQGSDITDNCLRIRADQIEPTGLLWSRALGRIPHHQHGFAQ